MNDYKELVFNLMFLAKYCHSEYNDLCVDDELKNAADAIEQLVKERDELTTKCCRLEQERDAAVADLEEDIKAIGKMEFLVKMCEAKYKNGGYEEYTHIDMDEIMCETLRSLGYEAGVAVFENTDKWYS